MGDLHHLSNTAIPIERDQLEQLLSSFTAMQEVSARAAAILLARLDDIDGDPDIELNGDELDGTAAEDDYGHNGDWRGGAGCVISDPDAAADDVGCDDNEMDLDEGYFDHPGRIPGGGSDDC